MALISNGDQVLTKNVYNTDETLLWAGNLTTIGSAMNLTEKMSNFESVKIYFNDVNGEQTNVMEIHTLVNFGRISCIEQMLHTSGVIYFRSCNLEGNIDSTLWTVKTSFSYTISGNAITGFDARTTNGQTIYVKPVKVVCINRKQTSTQEGI